jgi:PTS system ascorbate-specific IIB component
MTELLVTLKNLSNGTLIKKIFEGKDDFEAYKLAEEWAKKNNHDIFFFEILPSLQYSPENSVSILTICGCGVGSSILLGIHIKEMLKKLGIKGDVKEADVTTCKGQSVDIVVNQPTWMGALRGMRSYKRCVVVKNIVNYKEVEEKLKAALEDLKVIKPT